MSLGPSQSDVNNMPVTLHRDGTSRVTSRSTAVLHNHKSCRSSRENRATARFSFVGTLDA